MKNYYKILQIDPSAEKEIIEAAYRKLIKRYHPDVLSAGNKTSMDNNEKVRDITRRRKEYVNNENMIDKSIVIKFSNSKRTYRMNLIKKPDVEEPYIIKSLEIITEDMESSLMNRTFESIEKEIYGIRKNMLSIIRKQDADAGEIHIGDIDWTGSKRPDCGKVIQIRSGVYSSFGVCPKCHRMKCTGDGIRGVAGYHTTCPWC
jgi:hypothetical protein